MRRTYIGYHGVFGALARPERGFLRIAVGTLVVMVVLALVVDALFSPMRPPPAKPLPADQFVYEPLSWKALAAYYSAGLLFYLLVLFLGLLQDGTIQSFWTRWRWGLWLRYGQASLVGRPPKSYVLRRLAMLFDPAKVRLDTFYQWLSEANQAFEEGRLEEAVETYLRAALLRPESVVARVNLGAALGRMGRHEEALELFEDVLARDGRNGDARKNAALALLKLDRPAEAEALLKPHLETFKRDAEAWWLLGLCRARLGPEAAAEALQRACRLEPKRRADLEREDRLEPFLKHPAFQELLAK